MKLKRRSRPAAIDIMPLVDVVFLLLTFFVFSLAMLVRAEITEITLPALAGGQAGDRAEAVTVRLAADGTLEVGDQPADLPSLSNALTREVERVRSARADAPGATGPADPAPTRVLLVADARASAEHVFRVMMAMRDADVGSFGVVTSPADPAQSADTDAPAPPAPSATDPSDLPPANLPRADP